MSDKSKRKRKPNTGYKAKALKYIFEQKYDPSSPQEIIPVAMNEVRSFLNEHDLTPGNIHNFFKDIVRGGRMPRGLREIQDVGYHIIQTGEGGAFIRAGNEEMIDTIDLSNFQVSPIDVDDNLIPTIVRDLIRTDEGAVVSIVEYCSILETVFGVEKVYRVQSPLKVQPNEVDGCYIFEQDGQRILLAVEAKSKGPDVLLKHQIYGAAQQSLNHFGSRVTKVIPLGVKIQKDNTLLVVVFEEYKEDSPIPNVSSVYVFRLKNGPNQWIAKKERIG